MEKPKVKFTKQEDSVMDELYFVIGFGELSAKTRFDAKTLSQTLQMLIGRGLVEVLSWVDAKKEYLPPDDIDFQKLEQYFFLATKDGLFAHNS
jgi:hypothetical protein